MRIYIVSYLIITYVTNAIFVFVFSSLLGKVESQNFFQFLASSVYYVFPYTAINFLLTGIASCYLIKIILERKKIIALLPLVLIVLLDILIFIQFFNSSELSIIFLRIGFVLLSYLALYLSVNFNRFIVKS